MSPAGNVMTAVEEGAARGRPTASVTTASCFTLTPPAGGLAAWERQDLVLIIRAARMILMVVLHNPLGNARKSPTCLFQTDRFERSSHHSAASLPTQLARS